MAARRIGVLARHVRSGDAAAAVETEVKRTVGPEEQALLAAAEELFPGGHPMWSYSPVFDLADE